MNNPAIEHVNRQMNGAAGFGSLFMQYQLVVYDNVSDNAAGS
jgi:hypothetical protein